jgi:CDP-diacylglycerol--serine O-phosphatidyltransferase
MKHLPNVLTLSNLICGCIAVVYILNVPASMVMTAYGPSLQLGMEQLYMGSLFIGIAAVCDLLDGFTARALGLFSPIGKDLDSLADVVSFGVAPSMILFKLLWLTYMSEPEAMEVNMVLTMPAFLVAAFAALRLARFNIATDQQTDFKGMPTPAVGLLVASFPLIAFYNPYGIGVLLQGKWTLYGIIALLCWLMVSPIRFLKLMPARWQLSYLWPQVVLAAVGIAGACVIQVGIIPVLFVLYILLSLVYKQPHELKPVS